MKQRVFAIGAACLTLALVACSEEPKDVRDAGLPQVDAGRRDAGLADAALSDSGEPDAGAEDAGRADAGAADAGAEDAGLADAALPDSGEPDAGAEDAGGADAGAPDSGEDAGLPCCDEALCAAEHRACDFESCACVAIHPPCALEGAACDPREQQLASFVCAAASAVDGTCRAVCDPSASTDPCPEGFACADLAGYCAPGDCTGFFASECPAGERCAPVRASAWFCVADGAVAEGAACAEHAECGAGLLCLGGLCVRPGCTAISSDQPCSGASESCVGFEVEGTPIDLGTCSSGCVPFSMPDTCPSGHWCHPDLVSSGVGTCTAGGGTLAAGETCGVSAEVCADRLFCLAVTATSALCHPICDPAAVDGAPGSCAVDERCEPMRLGDDSPAAWGACISSCTPWLEPSSCSAGEWCMPDLESPGAGSCVDAGPLLEGAACDGATAATSCAAGMLCFEEGCTRLCDPVASAGEPGGCTQGFACQPLQVLDGQGVPADGAVGFCRESCVYDHDAHATPTVACASGGLCVPAILIGQSFDYCEPGYSDEIPGAPLAIGATCPDPAYGLLCNHGALCVDLGSGTRCHEACDPALAPYGPNHPDCTTPGDSCTQATASFGFCQ